MKLLHLKIFIAVWAAIMLVSFWVPKELLTAHLYSSRVMNWATFLWICSCFLAFWMGTFIERSLYAGNSVSDASKNQMPLVTIDKLERILKTFKGLLLLVSTVILIRVVWCIIKVGSLNDTFLFAITKPNEFKFDIWQQTTIHGMGAVSDIIVGCTIFAFALFALMKKYRSDKTPNFESGFDDTKIQAYFRTSLKFLILSISALAFYSILSNERVALVMGFLGGSLVYLLLLRRFPIRSLIYISILLLVVWVVVEGARRQYFGTETLGFILEYVKNRLLLYLMSGLRNVDTVVNYITDHTYGWYSFNFILVALKFDFLSSINKNFYGFTATKVVPGFAAIPVFGTAYADFGLAALLYFVVIGFIYQRLYRRAVLENSFLALQLYAFFLVALIVSFMPFLPTLARFWVNVLTLVVINKSLRLSLRDR